MVAMGPFCGGRACRALLDVERPALVHEMGRWVRRTRNGEGTHSAYRYRGIEGGIRGADDGRASVSVLRCCSLFTFYRLTGMVNIGAII